MSTDAFAAVCASVTEEFLWPALEEAGMTPAEARRYSIGMATGRHIEFLGHVQALPSAVQLAMRDELVARLARAPKDEGRDGQGHHGRNRTAGLSP